MKKIFDNFTIRFMPVAIVFGFAMLFKNKTFDELWNEMEMYLLLLLIPVVIYPIVGILTKRNMDKINELKKQEIRIPPIEKSTTIDSKKVSVKLGLHQLLVFIVVPLYLLNIIELTTYGKIIIGVEIIIALVITSGIRLQFKHIKELKSKLQEG